MKKYLIIIVAALISLSGFSQKKTDAPINITKAKLAEANAFSDLVKDFPKNSKIVAMEITAKNKGKLMQVIKNNEIFDGSVKAILSNADLNTKIYIDIKYSGTDGKATVRSYVFKVIE